ncbi:aspartate aminotransferase [Rhizobium sp. ACO-34A]|nr:pyridoxal phosphate-dependent aminotransferase [Rhizobium sp. ACO-34A]ATN32314.1 aspartate aminotransferase [Rhizobium sp. ACO-34A]
MAKTLFADRMQRIKPSPSSAASQRARELKAAGRDIVSLTVGEPDFDTPAHIIEAAIIAMRAGQTRYTTVSGTNELKQAIIGKFQRENGISYAANEVMASTGAKQIIFNAFMSTVQSGDEVIIPAPYWVSYPDITLLAGGKPVQIDGRMESDFKLTPEALEAHITANTRWLVINAPGNPSGAVYSEAELLALAEVLRRHPRIWVLSDDIYEHICFDGQKLATLAAVAPDLKERILTVNGVSKAYAMTGWRLGYCGGPAALIKEMSKLQSQSTTNPNSIAQAATVAALEGPQDFLETLRSAYQRRRDIAIEMLGAVEGLQFSRPSGAFYVFVGCEGLIGRKTADGKVIESDRDLAEHLLEFGGVAVVHGAAFGLSPWFRISVATSDDVLRDGLSRIAKACAVLQP